MGTALATTYESGQFSPILSLYDEGGNLLGNTAGRPEARVEGLEIPFDLVLLVEVSAGEGGGGDYTITVGDGTP